MKDTPDDEVQHGPADLDQQTNPRVPEGAEWIVITQTPYDPSEPGSLTTTIVYAIADAEGIAPRDVKDPPLFEVVDTVSLERTLSKSADAAAETRIITEFMYRDFRVVVRSDGWVVVHEPE